MPVSRLPVSLYGAKRALLTPHTAYMRWKSRDSDRITRAMFETQYYRPTMYAFIRAAAAKPDLLEDATIDSHSVVLDIGAYVGEWSERISRRYGARIYAFEPGPHGFSELRTRFDECPNVECFNIGLGGHDERARLALEGPGSTMYQDRGTFGVVDVEIRDVAAVLAELGIDRIDLCKINIEGAEYDLFDRLIATGWLPRIDEFLVQFHEWLPHAYRRRRAIRRALRRSHDEVWNYPFVWEFWRRR
jgi:FkbM family methyltransferase